jgi:RNA methyltransferase, TrmH family
MNKKADEKTMALSKAKFAEVKRLLQKKFREEEGKFIVEGLKSIDEAIASDADIETIIYDENRITDSKTLRRFKDASKEIITATEKDINALSDTVTSQGVIAVVNKTSSLHYLSSLMTATSALVVVVEGISDPGNLGTIIRTCDWFNVDALVISKNSVEFYNPKVVRATMGSIFHMPIISDSDLVSFLKKAKHEQFSVYSGELNNSVDIKTVRWDPKAIIVIGSESHGVSEEISQFADRKIKIPSFGKAESLNASIACGIILSQIKLQ